MRKALYVVLGVLAVEILAIAISSCGSRASAVRGESIPSDMPGVSCFAIRDDDGKVVGGNCFR